MKARLAATVVGLLCAVPGYATEGEWHASAGVVGAQSAWGTSLGLDGAWQHDTSDFWGFGVGARVTRLATTLTEVGGVAVPPANVQATFDVRCTLDALQWIPFAQLGLGAASDLARVDAAVRLEVGLGWRPRREAGWELRAGYWVGVHQHAGVTLSRVWYGGRGTGLEL